MFRKIISDKFEIDYIGKEWKKFSYKLFITLTGLDTLEEPSLGSANMFRSLFFEIKNQYSIVPIPSNNRAAIERVAQLCQTRFLPSAGEFGVKSSFKRFRKTTTSLFELKEQDLMDLNKAAALVAHRVSIYNKGKWPRGCSHISLSSSGDFDVPSHEGGRAIQIHREVREVLLSVPTEDNCRRLPFGLVLRDTKGVPRWRTWCRPVPVIAPPDAVFGELASRRYGESFILLDRRWGCDEALGSQIFSVALLKAQEWGALDEEFNPIYDYPPIPSRVSIVSEAGLKARTVTITKWWVIILQQPLGHFLRESLIAHPFARDGLRNDNQARRYVERLTSLNILDEYEDFKLLSSDLSEATDAIPHQVAVTLVGHILEKASLIGGQSVDLATGITGPSLFDNGYVRLALFLGASPRRFTYKNHTWVSRRGIMMGEPLAKGVLTLLNLAAEELAFFDHCVETGVKPVFGLGMIKKDKELFPVYSEPWRCVTVVGDDHAAYGPESYLWRITENHNKWGSILSTDKHGSGDIVRLCEEVIIKPFKGMWLTAYPTEYVYEKSLIIDSIKLRLVTRACRPRDYNQDTNPAIGKGIAISEKLSQMVSSRRDRSWKKMVVQAFAHSYSRNLPQGKDLHHMWLPKAFGGLGLAIDDEDLVEHIKLSGNFTRIVMGAASNCFEDFDLGKLRRMRRQLSALNSMKNHSHGFSFPSILQNSIDDYGWELACEAMSCNPPITRQICDYPKYRSGKWINQPEIEKDGFMLEDKALKELSRGACFNEIFSAEKPVVTPFRPIPYKKRMKQVIVSLNEIFEWTKLNTETGEFEEDIEVPPLPENLELVVNFLVDQQLAVSWEGTPLNEISALVQNEEVPFIEGQPMHFLVKNVQKTFKELVEKGLPVLALPQLLEKGHQCPPLWGEYVQVKSLQAKTTWFVIDD